MAEMETATDEVADADLEAAWNNGNGTEVVAEEKVEKQEEIKQPEVKEELPPAKASEATPESKVEEKLDHQESSKLGRKVHGLYEVIDQLKATVEKLQKPATREADIILPDVISTPEDVQLVLQAERQKTQRESEAKADALKQYQSGYTQQLNALGEANEDLHDEVMALIMENARKDALEFNRKYSDNPYADARVNYAEAKAHLLSKKLSDGNGKPKLPTRETASTKPVQPAAGATKMVAKTPTMPKLDADAQAYVAYLRRQNVSEEEIAESLKT